jgi:hypothetical protein
MSAVSVFRFEPGFTIREKDFQSVVAVKIHRLSEPTCTFFANSLTETSNESELDGDPFIQPEINQGLLEAGIPNVLVIAVPRNDCVILSHCSERQAEFCPERPGPGDTVTKPVSF